MRGGDPTNLDDIPGIDIPPGVSAVRTLPPEGFRFNGPDHIDPFGLHPVEPVKVRIDRETIGERQALIRASEGQPPIGDPLGGLPGTTDARLFGEQRGGKAAEMEKLTRAALDRGESVRIEAPNYVSCRLCGKTGSHTHTPAVRKADETMPVYVSEYENDEPGCNDCDGYVEQGDTCASCGLVGTIPRGDTLDTVIREVVESRRAMLKHMSADDVRAFFEGNLTVACFDGSPVRCLNRIDPATDALVDHLHPDPEHEPGNPNCLCFQRSCR